MDRGFKLRPLEHDEVALVLANHSRDHSGPYPPSGWKPNGPEFETPGTPQTRGRPGARGSPAGSPVGPETPETTESPRASGSPGSPVSPGSSVSPVSPGSPGSPGAPEMPGKPGTPIGSEYTSTQPPVEHSPQTPFEEYGPPYHKPISQNDITTTRPQEPTTETSYKDEEVEIINELSEFTRKKRGQKSEKLKEVEEFDVTTGPPSVVDKKQDSLPSVRDMGVYYIYHPNGVLQRIMYSTKDDKVNMEFLARLKYENVISIEDPLYTYDPKTLALQKIH
ncbi:unnamed protein product [Acanthoscelides obtectus]|uniref:Uncharacterized protein n=1 Tax=Acanthoscelides obtectus TaxID=200917 RepID=A0A9P0KED5_ACAOB|nr:unnamed protein product [Acanthoscelides obtectus]CAK1668758.1 hypothetical protein AOBTE_LOCUS26588 [Acanthoscelides obtectus]